MITYSTNYMGPISMDWFRKRGLTKHVQKKVQSEFVANMRGVDIGESYTIEEITTNYAGGRIDIRGLDEEEFYNGWDEYGLPIMHGEDWNALSDWLDEQIDETVRSYDELINDFENQYGKKIRWKE
jgi:hypothetical protein